MTASGSSSSRRVHASSTADLDKVSTDFRERRTVTPQGSTPTASALDEGGVRAVYVPPTLSAPAADVASTTASSGPPVNATESSEMAPKDIVRLPDPGATHPAYTFDMRGQWEGIVTSVGDAEFAVILRDIFNPGREEYAAAFSIEEVTDEDRDLLQVGAILYWTIGYRQQRNGQRFRASEIRLRRLPAWSKADMARVQRMSEHLDSLFGR